jgi:hypothetical protein
MFLFIPVTEPKDFFPFSEIAISLDTWFYFLFEHVQVLMLAFCLLLRRESNLIIGTYVLIQVVDTFDYLLFYGEPWSDFLPTWNICKVVIFTTAILYEKWVTRQ